MRYSRPRLRTSIACLLAASALAVGCGGDSIVPPTQTPGTTRTAVSAETPLPQPTPAATAPPTTAPSPTSPPPTATSAPAGISFAPAQLQQGGAAIIYLDEAALNATVTFGGRQYPMLQTGNRWWSIVGVGAFSEPGLAPVTIAYTPSGGGAARTITRSINIADYDYEVENIELDDETAALLDPAIIQNELAQRAAIYSGYTLQRFWSGAFTRPAAGALSSTYGVGRSYNSGPVTDYHRGTDFIGGIGDPVYAAAAGRVVFTGELRVRGNAVIVDHGAGMFTAYHHLSAIRVNQGDLVTPGQRIGDIGSTGLVTGPHLHWEVVIRGVEVDGRQWLAGQEIGP